MPARRTRSAPTALPCACSPTPRTHAVAVDPAIKHENLKHLRRIEGQIRGIAAMIDDDRYCADIITQVSAVRQSLLAVSANLMRNHLTHCAAAAFEHDGSARAGMIDEITDLVFKVTR